MANKKVTGKREIRLNQDLVGFMAEVIAEKIAAPGNSEKIQEMYEEKTGLKFSNIARVIARSNRKGVAEMKEQLIAEGGLEMKEVELLELLLKDLAKEKVVRNYATVEVPA